MKQSDSTEMDRLLRRYARRNGETLPAEDGQEPGSSGTHMDADELNAYAEGALPEVARVRYFAHLAECNTCRRLVTELTLASGISEEKQVAAPAPTPAKSWREWLAALLSPPVLRYAVPALALFGVIVVAVILMRSREGNSFVAQNSERADNSDLKRTANSSSAAENSSTNTAASEQQHPSANVSNSNIGPEPMPQPTGLPGVASASPQERAATTGQNAPAPPPPIADEPRPPAAQPEVADDKRGVFGGAKKAGEETASAPTQTQKPILAAPSSASTPVGPDDGVNNKRDEQAKTKNPERDVDETVVVTDSSAGSAAPASKTVANEVRRDRARKAPKDSAPPNAGARIAVAPAGRAADAMTEKEDQAGTRSVGGRQFRRQGNAWIDTAYNSSRSTIHVARGSEQYHALVADEPTLRAITQQLGGEVIVVWKGRSYRFY